MIIILILIYLVSVIACYKTIQFSYYNKKGKYYEIRENRNYPSTFDVFIVFCPIYNIGQIINYWLICHNYEQKTNWNKFFNKF